MNLTTLVVEDDSIMRRLFEVMTVSRGHEVLACDNAQDALRAFETSHHPLVLLDWMMEGMDGLELCRRMRASEGGEYPVILVITARDQPQDLQAVLAAGADDYITKPIDPDLLNVRLTIAEELVRQRAARRAALEKLGETMAMLEKSNEDLLSILNGIQIGTAMTDPAGHLTFLSDVGRKLLGVPNRTRILSRHWRKVFPVGSSEAEALERSAGLAPARRERVPVEFEIHHCQRRSVEVAVQDDPRHPDRKIFVFYDVTEVRALRKQLESGGRFGDMVGKSAPMQQVFQLIQDVASVDTTVLIEGETGTGKELVARSIHECSHRKDKPFVPVNCAGLTDSLLTSQLFGHRKGAFTGAHEDHEGMFEAANGGTIFLDEIGDIPMNVQTNLLRVLQEREITRLGESRPRRIDVRVVAATHRDLVEEARVGSFRKDLLYRVRVARISIPPLRKRKEDIPLLAPALLAQIRASTGKKVETIGFDAMRRLLEYEWPGNVRELGSAIERGVIHCKGSALQVTDLPPEVAALDESGPSVVDPELSEVERIREALKQTKDNRAAAARLLGVSRATFYRRLTRLRDQLAL